jgi:large subunit ribosomal protein L18
MRGRKILALKRRRKEKTNYKRRLGLLKSNKPRLAIRKSNNYITLQLIEFNVKNLKENTKLAYSSKKLDEFGWKYSKKNLPACYLAGLALGLLCKKEKIKEGILDLGLNKVTKGNKLFSALLGCVEGGLNINYSDKHIPSEDRIKGKHISSEIEKNFEITKQKILDYYDKK